MAAAVALVTERETADVPVSEIAEAADVSRRLVYQQFSDRDTLLLEAALDLARRELLPRVIADPPPDPADDATAHAKALALAEHMAAHRPFYRALYCSPCGFAFSKALNSLFLPVNRQGVRSAHGTRLDPSTVEDVATFLTGGWGDFVRTWVVEGPDPLDPEQFTAQLLRIAHVLLAQSPLAFPTPEGAVDDR